MSQHRAELDIDRKARAYAPVLPVRKQDAETRLGHFEEIYLTYEAEIARAEASRCIQCPDPAPCVLGCAIGNDIPTALRLVEEGNFIEAANIFRQTSPMPEICSRVCPQERLCEGSCTHGGGVSLQPIQIGKIEKFVIEYQYATEGIPLGQVDPDTGKSVAVVGGGPAGLAAAERLRRLGHAVTVYDANPYPGGLLLYGIPAYKLQKERIVKKVQHLEALGIRFVTHTRIGQDIPLQKLADEFDAVFIATGASVDSVPKWEGADLHGVYTATEYLIRSNVPVDLQPHELAEKGLPDVGHRVYVVGGGDTAMDCVRSSLRLQHALDYSLDVTCAYRRTEAEMPGCKAERVNAREEGAKFEWLTAPVRFVGDEEGNLTGIEFVRMTLGEPDESGRRRPVPLKGSEFVAPADTAILALGYNADPLLGETTPNMATDRWGLILIDQDTGKTSLPNVWAGGDAVTGLELVGTAIKSAQKAADSIAEFLKA
ncbi:MAG TPA: NAD(P)-dependent oxidoreductase [Aggregatilinea sp.]|uniref:NAD(P)-dependent oxidoreductase n=1 Tax=Aggregatilinea sp. TaxID=2806333 RepID=UPI002CE78884|nr:NAD(P)-dependent oxidoreductase [Aggregatilinea sp.]HML20731.1 NAD(P)-dependent oxidoreductase [Aggregatilinea sp.]